MLLVSLGAECRASFWAMTRPMLLRQREVIKRTRLAWKSTKPSDVLHSMPAASQSRFIIWAVARRLPPGVRSRKTGLPAFDLVRSKYSRSRSTTVGCNGISSGCGKPAIKRLERDNNITGSPSVGCNGYGRSNFAFRQAARFNFYDHYL